MIIFLDCKIKIFPRESTDKDDLKSKAAPIDEMKLPLDGSTRTIRELKISAKYNMPVESNASAGNPLSGMPL